MLRTPRPRPRATTACGARQTRRGPWPAACNAGSRRAPTRRHGRCRALGLGVSVKPTLWGSSGTAKPIRVVTADVSTELFSCEADRLGRGVDGRAIGSDHRKHPAAGGNQPMGIVVAV